MLKWTGRLTRRLLYIQVESTPNEHALKFLPGQPILTKEQQPFEFLKVAEAREKSPLAAQILQLRGISSVFFGPDFIAVNKRDAADWRQLKPQLLSLITDAVMRKEPFLTKKDYQKDQMEKRDGNEQDNNNALSGEESEVVQKIRQILDDKIRPAVQGDGGDVEFRGFVNGWVRLRLQGACRSCSSSVVTLRNGIENMLMYYVPEVKGVEPVDDDLDVASEDEFERVERELHAKQTDDRQASPDDHPK
jgi:Fe-S cluster biogenesis protein NfuA